MLIATFGPTTGWSGKSITFDNEQFTLEGHGPISAADVLTYDRQGHLVWANDGTRAWVESRARTPQVSRAVTPVGTPAAAMAAKPMPAGLEGVSRGDWVVVAASVVVLFGGLLAGLPEDYFYHTIGLLPVLVALAGAAVVVLTPIAAIVVVVLETGVVPGRRYDMGGRAPLIIMALGVVAFVAALVGVFVQPLQFGYLLALLGAASIVVGGYLKTEPGAARLGVAYTSARAAVTPQSGSTFGPPVASPAPVETHVPSPSTTAAPPTSGPATATTSPDPTTLTPVVTPPASAARHAEAQTDAVAPPPPVKQADPSPAPAATDSDVPATSVADEIAKLAGLHAKGILTDEEFAALKAKLI